MTWMEMEEARSTKAWIEEVCDTVGSGLKPIVTRLVVWLQQGLDPDTLSLPYPNVLLHGDSGCGKSYLAQHFAASACVGKAVTTVTLTPDDYFMSMRSVGETKLAQAMTSSCGEQQALLIIVESLERFVPLGNTQSPEESRVAAIFLRSLDAVARSKNVFVIGLTSLKDQVDKSAFSFGRFSIQVHIAAPRGVEQRLALLERLATRRFRLDVNQDVLKFAAQRAHGLNPAELEAVLREAFLWGQRHTGSIDEHAVVEALRFVSPSVLKEQRGNGTFRDGSEWRSEDVFDGVIGMSQAKRSLCLNVLLPLQEPDKLATCGLTPPKGVLLHGPSGNGKTFITAAFARGLENVGLANFIFIRCTDLVSKVVGETEKNITKVFARSRKAAPCILFFDQIEMLAPRRGGGVTSSEQSFDRLLSCLLVELDGISSKLTTQDHLVVIATTQDRDVLDPAILRPGRFDKHICVDNPDLEDRCLLVQSFLQSIPVTVPEGESLEQFQHKLASKLQGKSRAEIAGVFTEAAILALRDRMDASVVEWHHFESALDSS